MAYVRKKVSSYKWPVVIQEPDNGGYKQSKMTVTFKRVPQSRLVELADNFQLLIKEAVLGWEDYTDENGDPIPYSPETLEDAADDTAFVRGVGRGYIDSLTGAKEGN